MDDVNASNYVENAVRTESRDFDSIRARIEQPLIIRLQHASMGIGTEVGEFTDPLKKYIYYGKPMDLVNLREELGDILWYVAVALDAINDELPENRMTLLEILQQNADKLRQRFPDAFSEDKAINRDTDEERKILEGGDV